MATDLWGEEAQVLLVDVKHYMGKLSLATLLMLWSSLTVWTAEHAILLGGKVDQERGRSLPWSASHSSMKLQPALLTSHLAVDTDKPIVKGKKATISELEE